VVFSESEEELGFLNDDDNSDESSVQNIKDKYKKGDFAIVKYEGEFFPGVVNDTSQSSALVSVMVMSGSGWKWSTSKDEIWYKYDDVMQLIKSLLEEFLMSQK